MYKYSAEAFVLIHDAERFREKVSARSRDYCQHISTIDSATQLDFDDGCVTLRATDEGMRFRVETRDLVTFYAIRTLLQGSLSSITTFSGDSVEWRRS